MTGRDPRSSDDADLAGRVAARVVTVPDFPAPGVLFRDVLPVLADPDVFAAVVDHVVGRRAEWDYDVVVGLDARGFLLAGAIAYAAGCPLLVVRKAGKLPGPVTAVGYALEYGRATLELQAGAVPPGARVLIVDDVLATGGTLAAAVSLLDAAGAGSCHCWVLLELAELGGRGRISDLLDALLTV